MSRRATSDESFTGTHADDGVFGYGGNAEGVLVVSNVSKSFQTGAGSRRVLSEISLVAEPGSVVAVVGPSGCGKTTLLEIVCGLQNPDSGGCVGVGGEDVTGQRGRFAYMPQRDALLPWRTAIANATIGLEAAGATRASAREQAQQLFEVFNLAAFASYYPKELSIGMRQRVALLRTLLFPSRFMLLDEPFAALDAITRSNIHLWLHEAWRQFPRTVLLVTHDIDEAIFLADRVIVLSMNPSAIALDVTVGIPRPRALESTTTPEFAEIKRDLIAALGQQVQSFFSVEGKP